MLAGSSFICLAALNPDRFGTYHDDTIFVTTAKALATGQGYRIISMPNEPVQIKYPPFYPMLLSVVWRINPNFPENVTAMMLLSIIATVCFLGLAWHYLVKERYASSWQALLAISLAAVNWRLLISGTTIYSEVFYGSLSVAALWLAEVYERDRKHKLIGLVLGLVIGLAFLTRTSGVVLLIAVTFYYLLRREFRKLWLPVVLGAVFVFGWFGWCYAHSPDVGDQAAAYYTSTSYLHDFKAVIAEEQAANHSSKLAAVSTVVVTNFFMLVLMSAPMVCLGVDYNWIQSSGGEFFLIKFGIIVFAFIFLAKGFIGHELPKFRLLPLYIVVYLALHMLWPYSSYDRFLIPLLPFLLLFFVSELWSSSKLVKENLASGRKIGSRIGGASVSLVVLVLAGVTVENYASGMYRSFAGGSLRKIARPALGDDQAIDWINANTEVSDVLVCYRDSMYYLYTQRKAARSFLGKASVSGKPPDELIKEQAKLVLRIINENKARYLVVTSADRKDLPDLHRQSLQALLQQYPQLLAPVFESTDGQSRIYRINNGNG